VGDVAELSPRYMVPIDAIDSKFLFSHNSSWGQNLWPDKFQAYTYEPWSRENQIKFVYQIIMLREKYPHADAYILTEHDILLDLELLLPWVVDQFNKNPAFISVPTFGGPTILSAKAMEHITSHLLMRCSSESQFMEALGGGSLFDTCYGALAKACSPDRIRTATAFQACVAGLEQSPQCTQYYDNARPEFAGPLLVDATGTGHNQDHFLPYCWRKIGELGKFNVTDFTDCTIFHADRLYCGRTNCCDDNNCEIATTERNIGSIIEGMNKWPRCDGKIIAFHHLSGYDLVYASSKMGLVTYHSTGRFNTSQWPSRAEIDTNCKGGYMY